MFELRLPRQSSQWTYGVTALGWNNIQFLTNR